MRERKREKGEGEALLHEYQIHTPISGRKKKLIHVLDFEVIINLSEKMIWARLCLMRALGKAVCAIW